MPSTLVILGPCGLETASRDGMGMELRGEENLSFLYHLHGFSEFKNCQLEESCLFRPDYQSLLDVALLHTVRWPPHSSVYAPNIHSGFLHCKKLSLDVPLRLWGWYLFSSAIHPLIENHCHEEMKVWLLLVLERIFTWLEWILGL